MQHAMTKNGSQALPPTADALQPASAADLAQDHWSLLQLLLLAAHLRGLTHTVLHMLQAGPALVRLQAMHNVTQLRQRNGAAALAFVKGGTKFAVLWLCCPATLFMHLPAVWL